MSLDLEQLCQDRYQVTPKSLLSMERSRLELATKAFDFAMRAELKGDRLMAERLRKKAIGHMAAAHSDAPGYTFLTPALTGPYRVGVKRYYVEDPSRNEQQLGHCVDLPRRLELEVHYPAEQAPQHKYKVLSIVAKGGIEDSRLMTRSQPGLELADLELEKERFPLVFFSHGLGDSQEDYQQHVEELASHGFCVVTVNHPYCSLFTRLLGSAQCKLPRLSEPQIIKEGLTMAQDLAFLIEHIKTGQMQEFEEFFGMRVDKDAIALVGHSLGGWRLSMHVEVCRKRSVK